MKKILTILAATATLFAFGDDFTVSGTSFESYGDRPFDAAKDDSGDQAANTYWFTADADAANVLSNYVGDVVNADQTKTPTGVSRPDYFAPSNNTKYLSVETTGKLYRSLMPNGQSVSNITQVAIPDSGIYLDTLVKFTAADSVFGDDALEDGDKIAIEYVEHESEGPGDDTITNFVVRAGFIGSSQVLPTNYVVALPANFERDAWHRLTVRTLKNVDGHNRVGFKIYIDENVLNYITNNDKFAMSAGFEDDTHTIFPSAVDSGDDKTMISAVAFSGNGSIDDVVFTTDMPEFIASSEEVSVKFTADSGVTAISVQVAEVTNVVVDMTALTATLPPGTTAFTVTATIADSYTFAGMTVGSDEYDTNPANITNYAGGAIAITTTRNNFNVFNGSGDPISGTYQTLGAALAATGVAKIQLAYDYDVVAADIETYGYVDISQSITLDLNGKILDGGESVSNPLFVLGEGGNLVIIDSAGGGKVIYAGPCIVYGTASYIGASSGDFGPTFDGQLFPIGDEYGTGNIIRGKFDETSNTTSSGEPAFLWVDYLGDGDSVESECKGLVSGYWVVEPKGGSTTFALTTTGGANATVTTSPANVSALTEATEVTITATAAQDYTYDGVDLSGTDWTYDSQTDAISMTLTVSADTEIAVPDAVSEQSSDDWPTGQDLIDAEGHAAGDLFPGITNALATADAKAVATWAAENSVAYADKGSILPDAFLLDCANTQAAIDEAAALFKITAITVVGDTVTIAPADGADYGNGKVVIESAAALTTPMVWREKTAGDHFFRATLVVDPVAVP